MFPALLPTYNRTDVAFVRGEGSYLFAEDGKRYLDFGAGIAVNAFGHANARLVGALTRQAQTLWHTSNLYRVPGQESLSRKLVENTFADTCFFTNSGTEAIELAVKMARNLPDAADRRPALGEGWRGLRHHPDRSDPPGVPRGGPRGMVHARPGAGQAEPGASRVCRSTTGYA